MEPAFWAAVRASWGQLTSYDGFLGGEAFASAAPDPRAVVITRWRDESGAAPAAAWEAALDAHTARPGHGWFFTPVALADPETER